MAFHKHLATRNRNRVSNFKSLTAHLNRAIFGQSVRNLADINLPINPEANVVIPQLERADNQKTVNSQSVFLGEDQLAFHLKRPMMGVLQDRSWFNEGLVNRCSTILTPSPLRERREIQLQ